MTGVILATLIYVVWLLALSAMLTHMGIKLLFYDQVSKGNIVFFTAMNWVMFAYLILGFSLFVR